jgi:hypothetical protein
MLRRLPIALLALATLWIAALLQRGLLLGWDEIEFFRAAKWISQGQVPFRDFWEHHTPLQWLVFAPVAYFVNGPGAEAIVAMRWAQVPLWIGIFAVLFALAKEVDPRARWTALALLLASAPFVFKAIEFRVDVLGNLIYLAAILLTERRRPRRLARRRLAAEDLADWILFGALMSLAVLANMRLAPLVVLTAIAVIALERSARPLWMSAGVAIVGGAFLAYLFATGAWQPFVDEAVFYNLNHRKVVFTEPTFWRTLFAVSTGDVASAMFWLLGIAGAVLAWRTPLRILTILLALSVITVATQDVHYDYHFQHPMLLMLPLAALALSRMRELWRNGVLAALAVALVINFAQLVPAYGRQMDYQDRVMTDADRLTKPGETVFDGVGWALRRQPAYRHWFLPSGTRFMAARKLLRTPYDVEQFAANPPAALIFDLRVDLWFEVHPNLARYAVRHYVPVYRNLWVPGMTAIVGPEPSRVGWIAPRAGQYDVWASELLVKHPWLTKPEAYVEIRGEQAVRMAIPLERLPALRADALQWRVDGVAQLPGARMLTLRKGSRVELLAAPNTRAGVLLVPHGITTLAQAPEDDFVF